jgi:hypothetical protein
MSILPHGLTAPEIRILQEFRRLATEEMPVSQVAAIKHPFGGGEAQAWSLVEKGWLAADESRQTLTLQESAKELLAYEPAPGTDAI